MKKYCCFNGKIMANDKLWISPYDLGLLRGYAVFDVMCTENKKPFMLKEHWQRFKNSAKELNLEIPISQKEFANVLKKLIHLNGYEKSTIRTVLSGGISSDAYSPEGKETFFILIEKFYVYPEEVYQKGVKVLTVNHSRPFPKSKTTNYVLALKHHKNKINKNAFELLYEEKGKILEASSSNLFIVKKEKIITPEDGILIGITRKLVLKLAENKKIQTEERDIKISEFFSADEIFLTATNKGIVPVVRVDNKKIGQGKVGEVTKKLMKIFNNFSKSY